MVTTPPAYPLFPQESVGSWTELWSSVLLHWPRRSKDGVVILLNYDRGPLLEVLLRIPGVPFGVFTLPFLHACVRIVRVTSWFLVASLIIQIMA
ncbi:hypothetical protein VTN00DRAFT_5745 [Thermoascus crustaceus]|uniref:uncharacterized protein n=1 Tax=Thermoascus crustaceus TaxID=5088 RepID=UPI00374430D4